MDREQYLNYRNKNSPEMMYEYYKEHHKGGILLALQDFVNVFLRWPHGPQAVEKVTREYDIKFEITSVQDLKTGQILKYL